MTNIWKRRMMKGHTTPYDIAKKTNIPEEKVKEILNGERELPSNYVNPFLEATEPKNNKIEHEFTYNDALRFFTDHDPRVLRKDFGYETQKELADVLGISNSSICRLELKDFDRVGPNTVIKIYDFFNNDLNRNLKQKKVKKPEYKQELKVDDINLNELRAGLLNKYGSITNAADALGIGRSTLYQILSAHHKPRKKVLYKLVSSVYEDKSQDNKVEQPMPVEAVEVPMTETNEPKIEFTIGPKFDPNTLFRYLVKEGTNYNVFTLYKLLNTYFTNNVVDTTSINLD